MQKLETFPINFLCWYEKREREERRIGFAWKSMNN